MISISLNPSISSKPATIMNPNKNSTELPESIRHHILSLVPTAKAMAAAQLSKTWQHDWLSLPCLDFDKQFFKQTREFRDNSVLLPIHEEQRIQNLLYDFITRTLERRASLHSKQGSASALHLLQRLSLYMPYLKDSSKLYSLLKLAFSSFKIEELEIAHNCFWVPRKFKLPCHVNVHSLKSLGLKSVALHQSTVDMLALNCPFLELLKFKRCRVLGSVIEFRGLSKLLKLYLVQTLFLEGQLVINLPCLLSLYYSAGKHLLRDEFDMDVINAEDLRTITLRNVNVKEGIFDQFLPYLPRLESLQLRPSHYTKKLRISNHCLKHLSMKLDFLASIELCIDAPRLENFIYSHKVKRVRSQPTILITNNFAPKKSILQLKLKDLKDVKLTEFLQKINAQSKYLELHMEGREFFKMKDNINHYGTICGIKHVVLLDQSVCTSPMTQCMTLCIGGAMRLFPDVETLVASQVKYYRGEVDQKVNSFRGKLDKQVKWHDNTGVVFEAMV